ncbi:unannotated protein [freshwater metagenome]|uniref:Unannotated protein n=1 Tax=freshwater metagenome TaxID=449393 RepID=A0A6J6S0I5_9ZZZZ
MAPKITAAIKPTQGPCLVPIMPPAHAPIIIMPSKPMFTTPERSEKSPPSPAKTIGTESNNAADAVPTLVKSVAPVIWRTIDKIKTTAKALTTIFGNFINFILEPPLQVLYSAA